MTALKQKERREIGQKNGLSEGKQNVNKWKSALKEKIKTR
jgi:hypothetical protein